MDKYICICNHHYKHFTSSGQTLSMITIDTFMVLNCYIMAPILTGGPKSGFAGTAV
jgi:hypothetical protein